MMLNRNRIAGAMTWALRIVPLLLLVGGIAVCSVVLGRVSVEDILHFTPQNYLLAALIMVGIYAVKSLSVFFPLLVLYVSAGSLFPPWLAVAVNFAGLFACVSIPYWLGRLSGRALTEKLLQKYKKAQALRRFNTQNEWFVSYILRVINLLPGDIVSILLGSMGVGYRKFVLGSLAGLTPTMLAATFLGANILSPTSPGFIGSAVATVLISALSILIYRGMMKRAK